MMNKLLNTLLEGNDLSNVEIKKILDGIISGEVNDSQTAAFLAGLRVKGETVEEITGLIEGMRKHMIKLPGITSAIDTCGTGGDGAGTFNISTTVALVTAGAGVPVVKHGNRAASSQCGSADVLEALGVNIILKPEQAKAVFDTVGMVFLFAPLYHPAMKHIAPIRKELGVRTVFNYLGPFLNPAGVKRQLIGVPSPAFAKKLARVAANLDYEHLLIVSNHAGLDEFGLSAGSTMYEVKNDQIKTKTVDPVKLGFKNAGIETLQGADIVSNAKIIRDILGGQKGAPRDIVVLNAAHAIYVAGKVKTVAQGIKLAEESLNSGSAERVLEQLIKETKNYA